MTLESKAWITISCHQCTFNMSTWFCVYVTTLSFQGLFEAKNVESEIEHLEFLIRSLSQPMSELHASLNFCATGMFTTSLGTYGIIMS